MDERKGTGACVWRKRGYLEKRGREKHMRMRTVGPFESEGKELTQERPEEKAEGEKGAGR